MADCPYCNGAGVMECNELFGDCGEDDCNNCDGSGQVDCDECDGSGVIVQ